MLYKKTVSYFLAVLLILSGSLCAAQVNNSSNLNDSANKIKAPVVDWNNGTTAQRLVELWLKKGEVPALDSLNKIYVTGLIGVKVTLRSNGAVAGAGQSFINVVIENINNKPVDMVAPLAMAAKSAFSKLKQRLRSASFKAAENNHKQNAKVPKISDIADNIMVDIQLGYNLQRIRLPKGAKSNQVFHTFSPDWNGLMLLSSASIGQYSTNELSDASFLWPATAQSHNAQPTAQIMSLLHQQGLGLKALKSVAMPGGANLWKFKVVHVVRPGRFMPVMHLVRGGVLLPQHAISEATLGEISGRITSALKNRFVPDKKLVRGTFLPSTGSFQPSVAKPRDAALACYALTVRAKYLLDKNSDSAAAKNLATLALATVKNALSQVSTKDDSHNAVLALGLLTMCDTPISQVNKNLRNTYGTELLDITTNNKIKSFAVKALSAAALASWYQHTRSAQTRDAITGTTGLLWKQMAKRPNISALQWLLLAQHKMALSGYKNKDAQSVKKQQAAARNLIETLIKRQVSHAPEQGPADVIGGFQLMGLPADSPPTPTWHSAQVVSILASGLAQKGIAEGDDNITWLLSAGLGARFIGQLMITRPDCWYIRDKDQALGGIRTSLWDNSLSVSASATSLLALVQLEQLIANTNSN